MKPLVFQLDRRDGPALVKHLGLACNALSPLAGTLAATESLEATRTALTRDARTAQALGVLADPALRLGVNTGGSLTGRLDVTVYRNPQGVVALVPGLGDAVLVHVLDSLPDLVEWSREFLGTRTDPAPAPLLPPTAPFVSMVYVLHALDLFRRQTYQAQLEGRAGGELHIPGETFVSALKQTVHSGDLRWVLACFRALVPGAPQMALDATPAHLDWLAAQDILLPRGSGFVFGAKGRCLAVEFYRTWVTCAGLELRGSDQQVRHRSFLASTALANHHFDLGAGGEVRYQPLTQEHLGVKLQELLCTPVTAPVAVLESAPAAARFCAQCGNKLGDGAKFCRGCGRAVGG